MTAITEPYGFYRKVRRPHEIEGAGCCEATAALAYAKAEAAGENPNPNPAAYSAFWREELCGCGTYIQVPISPNVDCGGRCGTCASCRD